MEPMKGEFAGFDPAELTPELDYKLVPPPPSFPMYENGRPPWVQGDPWHEMSAQFRQLMHNQGVRVDSLRETLTRLGVTPTGRRRDDLIDQLITAYTDPERLQRAVSALDADHLRHYIYLVLSNLFLNLGTIPNQAEILPGFTGPSEAALQRLVDDGLVYTPEEGYYGVVPESCIHIPPIYLPFPTEPKPKAYTPAQDPNLLLAQVSQMLSMVQTGHYALRDWPRWFPYSNLVQGYWPPTPEARGRMLGQTRSGPEPEFHPQPLRLDDASLQALSEGLGVSQEHVDFLYNLLVSAGLLLGGNPVIPDGALAQTWLTRSAGQQMMDLFLSLMQMRSWAEWWSLWRAGQVRIRSRDIGMWMMPSIDAVLGSELNGSLRLVLLGLLSFLPHDAWLAFDKLEAWLGRVFPDPSTHRYIRFVRPEATRGGWKGFLGVAAKALICGPLHLMGMADLGPEGQDPRFFCLHGVQDAYWAKKPEFPVPSAEQFEVDAMQFDPAAQTLSIATPMPAGLAQLLPVWAAPAGFSGRAVRYRLSVERLHGAFEAGETPESLEQAWTSRCDLPLPPEVRAWWRNWWPRYGHVRIYSDQTALMTRDEFTMQELQAALPVLRKSVLGLVTPRAALIEPGEAEKIRSGLARQGYMPKEVE